MKEIGGVAIAQAVVPLDAEPGQPLGAVADVELPSLGVLIAQALAPGVVGQQKQPRAHLVLIGDLQGVVAAVGVGGFVGAVAREFRERNVELSVGAVGQDLGIRVVVSQVIEVTALSADICRPAARRDS